MYNFLMQCTIKHSPLLHRCIGLKALTPRLNFHFGFKNLIVVSQNTTFCTYMQLVLSFSIHTYMTELNKVLVQHISTKQIVAISPEVRKHVHEDRIGQFLSEGDPRNIRCVGYVCFYHRGNFSPLQIHHFESGVKTTACSQHRCFLFQDLHGFFLYTHSLFGLLTLGSLFVVAKSQAIK